MALLRGLRGGGRDKNWSDTVVKVVRECFLILYEQELHPPLDIISLSPNTIQILNTQSAQNASQLSALIAGIEDDPNNPFFGFEITPEDIEDITKWTEEDVEQLRISKQQQQQQQPQQQQQQALWKMKILMMKNLRMI